MFFLFKVMLVGSLGVSGACTLQISCIKLSNLT